MKKILFIIILTSYIIPQSNFDDLEKKLTFNALSSEKTINKFIEVENKYRNKIPVGSSIIEVKNIMGKPTRVLSGFPDTENIVIMDIPNFIGQVNYSTWMYQGQRFTLKNVLVADCDYYLNNIKVDEDLFSLYERLNVVYFYNSKIIAPGMADSYKLLKDTKLHTEPKNVVQSQYRKIGEHKETYIYYPIISVVFDKGTQAVTAVKLLYSYLPLNKI